MRISEKPPGFTTAFSIQTKPRPNKTEDFFRKVCPLGGLNKGRQVFRSHPLPAPAGRKKVLFFFNRNHTKRGRVEDIHKFLSLEVAAQLLQHCVMSLRTFLSVSSVMFRRLQTLSAMKELFCSLAAERVLSLRTFSHPSGTSYWCFHSSPVLSLGLIVDPIFFFPLLS